MPSFGDVVEAELLAHEITLCRGCKTYNSHNRGFAIPDERAIHYARLVRTRATLYGFLHEVGHIVRGHGKASTLRRFEQEAEANTYAEESLRAYGIAVPRAKAERNRNYVARMKRWGKNIAAGRRRARRYALEARPEQIKTQEVS